jgi:hypothetical protein
MTHRTLPIVKVASPGNLRSVALLLVVFGLVATSLVLAHRAEEARGRGFFPVVIRGGGFVTGLTVQGDMMYARTDVGGAYRFDGQRQRWEQMITASSIPADRRPTDYQVEGLGAAPSDPSTVYMLVGSTSTVSPGSRILRSNDAGRNWIVLPQDWFVGGNDNWRQSGTRVAVDPTDPRTVYVGTRRDGVKRSLDGGSTWETVMPPTAFDQYSDLYSIGVPSVAIDPSSPVVDGRHTTVWAGVAGVGLMRSSDSGRRWVVVSPFQDGFVSDTALMPDGAVIASFFGVGEGKSSAVRRVDVRGSVTDITPPSDGQWLTLASDPSRPGTLVVAPANVRKGVGVFTTRDSEAPKPDWVATSTSIADGADGTTWPTDSDVFDYLSTGQIRYFDGQVWFAEGMGMWSGAADFSDSVKWHFASDGIEELVGNSVYKPTNGSLLTAAWDRGLMRHPDPTDRDPTGGQEAGFPYTSRFGAAWDITASPTNPDFLAVVLDDSQDLAGRTVPERRASGYSTDAGVTWKRFDSLANGTAPPDLLFGNIAVSAHNDNNLVWVPSNLTGANTKVYYSRDAGASWYSGVLNGLAPDQFLHPFYVQARKILVADPGAEGVFYALGSDGGGAAILWKSTDGGANWNILWRSDLAEGGSNGFKYDSSLAAVGGYLIAAPGPNGGCLYRSRDETQWEKICTIRDAVGIGLGAPIDDGGNDALYTYGSVDGEAGVYRSTDLGKTWRRLSEAPDGVYVGVRAIAGDPVVKGRVYIGLAGGGFVVGQF